MDHPMHRSQIELAQLAAQLVVDDGMPYGEAKRRAAERLGLGRRAALPDNDTLEDAVREHIALYCADTQPAELRALREVALSWMKRLSTACPDARWYATGAVWNGTATRWSDVHLQCFGDDPKAPEIALLNAGLRYDVGDDPAPGGGERLPRLSLLVPCAALGAPVGLHISVHPLADLHGGLRQHRRGQSVRGDASALQAMMGV